MSTANGLLGGERHRVARPASLYSTPAPRHFPCRYRLRFPRRAGRISKDVAAPPDRLDVMVSPGRLGQLLAQFADEDVDDLKLGLIHPAVEVVEEHLLRQNRALA